MTLNSVYITAGVAIILALLAALVGPLFVDWTAYRSTFERYAGEALGHKVTVLGKADMSLLPAPALTFTDVRVGDAENPLLSVSRFQMRVELPSLLKGEIRVVEMRLDRPQANLALDEYGRLDWLMERSEAGLARVDPKNVAFDQIEVNNGSVTLSDARDGGSRKIENVNVVVSARSLNGPFKVDGSLSSNGEPMSLRLATGERQPGGGIRVKADLTPALTPAQLSVDALLSDKAGAPELDGRFTLASVASDDPSMQEWRVQGDVKAGPAAITVPSFELRYGPDERHVTLTGEGNLDLAASRRFLIKAGARQLDLDRMLGQGPQQPVAIRTAGQSLLSGLAALAPDTLKGEISLDLPAIVAGGEIIQGTRLDLETAAGGWKVLRLASRLPGRTQVTTQGDLSLQGAPSYSGTLVLNSAQPGLLTGWLQGHNGLVFTGLPVALEGKLDAGSGGVSFAVSRLDIDGAKAAGSIAYTHERNGKSVFSLGLEAEKLDLDLVSGLAPAFGADALGGMLAGAEIDVKLHAREVSIRGIKGKALTVEAGYDGEQLKISKLSANDLAGARIDALGTIRDLTTVPSGSLNATLEASSLAGLYALIENAAPDSELTRRLQIGGDYLVPAKLDGRIEAKPSGQGSEMRLVLSGEVNGNKIGLDSRFAGRMDAWRDGDAALTLNMSGPEGALLLRQLGFDVASEEGLGAAELALKLNGQPGDSLAVSLDAKAGTSRLEAVGDMELPRDGVPLRYTAGVTLKSQDLSPAVLMTGQVLPALAGDLTADLRFDLLGEGGKLTLSDIKGVMAGVTVAGRLTGDLTPAAGSGLYRISGALDLSALDARLLSEVMLGADQWALAEGNGVWPGQALGTPFAGHMDLGLDLKAGKLWLDDLTAIETVSAKLRIVPDSLRLEGLEARYGGGSLSGQVALTRNAGEAGFSGTLQLTGAQAENLVWQRSGRAVATGTLDVNAQFETSGRSIAALAAGLSGGGTVALKDGELRALNPEAFSLIIRAADSGLQLEEDKVRSLFVSQLDAGTLPFASLEGSLSMAAGRVSLRNLRAEGTAAALLGSGQINLNDWTVQADLSLKADAGEDAVAGAEPQAAVIFSGPLGNPERRIDTGPLMAFLTLRAFEKEVERVERLQADILDRDRLAREMKYFREAEEQHRTAEKAAAEKAAAEKAAAEKAAAEKAAAEKAAAGNASERQPEKAPESVPAPDQRGNAQSTAPSRSERAQTGPKPANGDAIGDLLTFEEKIQSAIGNAGRSGAAGRDPEAAGSVAPLPPLEPAKEIPAAPRVQGQRSDAGAGGPADSIPANKPAQPVLVTMPSGLVVTYPAPGN
ncbi:AsmA family protein [Pannonibacter indicus]|uniref:AsmA family protein n=1 Tax=Pannonibacter indicus TaxID=466044 RepID=UPI00391CB085